MKQKVKNTGATLTHQDRIRLLRKVVVREFQPKCRFSHPVPTRNVFLTQPPRQYETPILIRRQNKEAKESYLNNATKSTCFTTPYLSNRTNINDKNDSLGSKIHHKTTQNSSTSVHDKLEGGRAHKCNSSQNKSEKCRSRRSRQENKHSQLEKTRSRQENNHPLLEKTRSRQENNHSMLEKTRSRQENNHPLLENTRSPLRDKREYTTSNVRSKFKPPLKVHSDILWKALNRTRRGEQRTTTGIWRPYRKPKQATPRSKESTPGLASPVTEHPPGKPSVSRGKPSLSSGKPSLSRGIPSVPSNSNTGDRPPASAISLANHHSMTPIVPSNSMADHPPGVSSVPSNYNTGYRRVVVPHMSAISLDSYPSKTPIVPSNSLADHPPDTQSLSRGIPSVPSNSSTRGRRILVPHVSAISLDSHHSKTPIGPSNSLADHPPGKTNQHMRVVDASSDSKGTLFGKAVQPAEKKRTVKTYTIRHTKKTAQRIKLQKEHKAAQYDTIKAGKLKMGFPKLKYGQLNTVNNATGSTQTSPPTGITGSKMKALIHRSSENRKPHIGDVTYQNSLINKATLEEPLKKNEQSPWTSDSELNIAWPNPPICRIASCNRVCIRSEVSTEMSSTTIMVNSPTVVNGHVTRISELDFVDNSYPPTPTTTPVPQAMSATIVPDLALIQKLVQGNNIPQQRRNSKPQTTKISLELPMTNTRKLTSNTMIPGSLDQQKHRLENSSTFIQNPGKIDSLHINTHLISGESLPPTLSKPLPQHLEKISTQSSTNSANKNTTIKIPHLAGKSRLYPSRTTDQPSLSHQHLTMTTVSPKLSSSCTVERHLYPNLTRLQSPLIPHIRSISVTDKSQPFPTSTLPQPRSSLTSQSRNISVLGSTMQLEPLSSATPKLCDLQKSQPFFQHQELRETPPNAKSAKQHGLSGLRKHTRGNSKPSTFTITENIWMNTKTSPNNGPLGTTPSNTSFEHCIDMDNGARTPYNGQRKGWTPPVAGSKCELINRHPQVLPEKFVAAQALIIARATSSSYYCEDNIPVAPCASLTDIGRDSWHRQLDI